MKRLQKSSAQFVYVYVICTASAWRSILGSIPSEWIYYSTMNDNSNKIHTNVWTTIVFHKHNESKNIMNCWVFECTKIAYGCMICGTIGRKSYEYYTLGKYHIQIISKNPKSKRHYAIYTLSGSMRTPKNSAKTVPRQKQSAKTEGQITQK